MVPEETPLEVDSAPREVISLEMEVRPPLLDSLHQAAEIADHSLIKDLSSM